MIERRREKQTLNALGDLVTYLRGVREERKAIITITDGWRLFGADPTLARRVNFQVPTGPQVTIDPRTGRPTSKPTPNTPGRGLTNMDADPQICERDRMALALLDDEQQFRTLLQEANRANASFYPIDPARLVVFDEPISQADHRVRTGGRTPAPRACGSTRCARSRKTPTASPSSTATTSTPA